MFKGCFTALITPFKQGKVDEKAFHSLVEWQIKEGIHGLVPCGTTGESPTLSHEEHNHVIELCVKAARGRVPVMAGTGSNSTDEAIMMTRHAQKVGADAALIVSPYYNKPTPEGIYQHFKAIHDATKLPIFVYNIPGRSVIDIKDETMVRLAALPRMVGLKDATGDLARPSALRLALGAKAKKFTLFSGEDATAAAFNAQGGVGCISVTSNIAPKLCAQLQEACFANDYVRAGKINDALMPLHRAMFCETSPGPVKFAASLLKRSGAELRLPLVEPSAASKQMVTQALKSAGLL
jgi:4-hydroxy-tetrahydrodipicolinate synthase